MYIILEKREISEKRCTLDTLKIMHQWKSDVHPLLHFFFSSATNFYRRPLSRLSQLSYCHYPLP